MRPFALREMPQGKLPASAQAGRHSLREMERTTAECRFFQTRRQPAFIWQTSLPKERAGNVLLSDSPEEDHPRNRRLIRYRITGSQHSCPVTDPVEHDKCRTIQPEVHSREMPALKGAGIWDSRRSWDPCIPEGHSFCRISAGRSFQRACRRKFLNRWWRKPGGEPLFFLCHTQEKCPVPILAKKPIVTPESGISL